MPVKPKRYPPQYRDHLIIHGVSLGISFSEIATKLKLSRERVRQRAVALGLPTGRQLQRERRRKRVAERQGALEDRRQERDERREKQALSLARLWVASMAASDAAGSYDVIKRFSRAAGYPPESVGPLLARLRATYGMSLFPHAKRFNT